MTDCNNQNITGVSLRILSDLHLEMYRNINSFWKYLNTLLGPLQIQPNEILILAGDIGSPVDEDGNINASYIEVLSVLKQTWNTIIMVSGNHEYYKRKTRSILEIDNIIRKICSDIGIHFLQKSKIVIGDVQFLGCTLWSDVDEHDYAMMNDSRYVFESIHVQKYIHEDHKLWIIEQLQNTELKTVVITHHLPTSKLSDPSFGNRLATAFYTNLEHVMDITPLLKYWICGHSHMPMVALHNEVRLVLNPIGYPKDDLSRIKRRPFTDSFELV
jgi:predicted phosphohydrolase